MIRQLPAVAIHAFYLFAVLLAVVAVAEEPSRPTAAADEQNATKDIWRHVATRKLSEIELPSELFGHGWRKSDGIRINDMDNLEDIRPEIRNIADKVRDQLAPHGIVAVADYCVVRTEWPLNTITVQVFIFKDPETCRSWWTKKYKQDGWEKRYRTVKADSYVALDSLEQKMRTLAFGSVWMTTHQLQDSDDHLTAAEHVLKQLVQEQEDE